MSFGLEDSNFYFDEDLLFREAFGGNKDEEENFCLSSLLEERTKEETESPEKNVTKDEGETQAVITSSTGCHDNTANFPSDTSSDYQSNASMSPSDCSYTYFPTGQNHLSPHSAQVPNVTNQNDTHQHSQSLNGSPVSVSSMATPQTSKPSVLAQRLSTNNQSSQHDSSQSRYSYLPNPVYYPSYSQQPAAPQFQVISRPQMVPQHHGQYVYRHVYPIQQYQYVQYQPQQMSMPQYPYHQVFVQNSSQQVPPSPSISPVQMVHGYPHQPQYFSSQMQPIPPNSIIPKTEINVHSFATPPNPVKMTILPCVEKKRIISLEPYKAAFGVKRSLPKEVLFLREVNRDQVNRWRKCIEFVKINFGTDKLVAFIVGLLEESETSNDLIQWKEKTKYYDLYRAFEFVNKNEVARLYSEFTGVATKYNGISNRLTRLSKLQSHGYPIFMKTKYRNTYQILPTLFENSDGNAADILFKDGRLIEDRFM